MIPHFAAAFGCALCLLFTPVRAETVTLGLDAARSVARDAYLSGDPSLALALSLRLLEADPHDPQSLLLVSAAQVALGQPELGFAAGQKAWHFAPKDAALRYEIARHTALAAYQNNQFSRAQFWLRRASDYASDDTQKRQTAEDYAQLRAQNPLSFMLSFGIAPSTNINGGAKGQSLLIDRDFVLGNILRDGQALAGVQARARAQLRYRISQSARSQTLLGLRLSTTAHRFSTAAQKAAPSARARDLNETGVEVSLNHDFITAQGNPPINLSLNIGQNWAAGHIIGPNLRVEAALPLIARKDFALRLAGAAERQWQPAGTSDAVYVSLDSQRSATNGVWSLGVRASKSHGDGRNQNSYSIGAQTGFAPDASFGPFTAAGRLNATYRAYAAPYELGAGIAVRDGRQDQTIDLSIDFGFKDLSWMGFTPTITLSQTETRSNISRYDTSDTGIAFGINTQF